MLGFKHALEKARPGIHRVDCVISGKMPDVFAFLPGIKEVLRMETATTLLDQYDLAISVDCGSIDRLGLGGEVFAKAKVSANIDHHVSNDHFGQINVVETSAAASGEVVYDILKTMKIPMDANIATCLYTAIITDTGSFKYSNTTSAVMEKSAQLIAAGADPEYINKQIYEEQPLSQVMMQADAVRLAQFNSARTIGWTVVSKDFLTQHGALDEHVDGLVESLRRIDSVLIAVVFKETLVGGHTKVSIRSDNHAIDVSEVMGRFGGGGHKLAAGCTIELPLDDAVNALMPMLEEKAQLVHAKVASPH